MYKRPKVVDKLRSSKATRQRLPDLSSFLEWLWPLTAAPQRFFRGHAIWLHKHLATLQLADRSAEGANSPPPTLPEAVHGLETSLRSCYVHLSPLLLCSLGCKRCNLAVPLTSWSSFNLKHGIAGIPLI